MEHRSKKAMSKTILIVAAHPDDEVIGCGASIAKWTSAGDKVHVLIMAEGATSRNHVRDPKISSKELSLLKYAAQSAGDTLGVSSVKLLDFPDNRMDSLDRLEVIKAIEKEIEKIKPHTVVTHHAGDVNIDHRIIHEAVVTACRPQPGHSVLLLLAFEVVSSTEWQPAGSNIVFQPNWFEDVSSTFNRKIIALEAYQSEMRDWPHPRSLKNIEYLARSRGSSIGCNFAEGFMVLRVIQ